MMIYDGKLYGYNNPRGEEDNSYFTASCSNYRLSQQELPELPTGTPTGPSPIGAPITPELPVEQQIPVTVESTLYLPGYLRTQIGKNVRVEFLIGSSGPLVDRVGILTAVGASYILIRPIETDDILMCDLYSIKFVTVYQ